LCIACSTSQPQRSTTPAAAPIVVLVSLDGFRADYLDRAPAVELRSLAQRGVRARHLVPVFPTKTFPNHYTIVTGLYPEHHGVISNTMWDSVIGKTFSLSARDVMVDPRWWGGEPLWITAGRQGHTTASFFWPGSDVAIGGTYPTHYKVYDSRIANAARVDGVLEWLSRPAGVPSFVTLYFSDVDHAGHDFGPDAPQTDSAIARVDSAVGALLRGLTRAGLEARAHVIIVADHGMSATSPERQIFLDDYLDVDSVRVVEWSPVAAIIPAAGQVEAVYRRLHGKHPALAVYRKGDVPARLRFNHHPRITPIIALANDGWHISTHARPLRDAGGNHGYDNALPSMRAVFVAAGPRLRRNVLVEPFQTVHLYELMAHILGVRPAGNDGSLDSVRSLLVNPR
jgi:predicted AlkP superfamily pyrophosphatase or phosphodiesterase